MFYFARFNKRFLHLHCQDDIVLIALNPHLHSQEDNNMPGGSENADGAKRKRPKPQRREPITKTEQDCFGMEFPDECFHYSFKRKESNLKEL